MRFVVLGLVVAAVAAAALAIDDRHSSAEPRRPGPSPTTTPTPTPAPRAARNVAPARCPAGIPGCRAVRGTVIYVERVDPDGDGDLHVVVAAGSITLPGMTSVDVARELRPRRDPRIGDRVSAAGPVQRGSFGQSQVHAVEFHAR
jgi:hypothetical protein